MTLAFLMLFEQLFDFSSQFQDYGEQFYDKTVFPISFKN